MYSGEEEDPPVNVTAQTSTSHTSVLSDTRPDETSPPQQDVGHPTPVASPRASSPKRARIEPGRDSSLLTSSSAAPHMDDVSVLLNFFFAIELFPYVVFLIPILFQPLMKEFVRLGTQFIGYRDHTAKLKGIPLLLLLIE
jgi:hypothetical protein